MPKCISWLGHRWSAWTGGSLGEPRKADEGFIYRQRYQRRSCLRCKYIETHWTNEAEYLFPAESQQNNEVKP